MLPYIVTISIHLLLFFSHSLYNPLINNDFEQTKCYKRQIKYKAQSEVD